MARTIVVSLLFLLTAFSLFLAILSIIRRQAKFTLFFSLLSLAAFFYMGGYAIEVFAQSFEGSFLGTRISYLGVVCCAPLWLLFTFDYCNYPIIKKRIIIPLFIIPAIVFAMMQTDILHHLYYNAVELIDNGVFTYIHTEPSLIYFIHVGYLYLLLLVSLAMHIRTHVMIRKIFSARAIIIMINNILPLIAGISTVSKITVLGIDFTPISIVICTGIFALSQIGIFKVTSISRDRVFETMRDAVIIFNQKHQYLDSNQTAKDLFPDLCDLMPGSSLEGVSGFPQILGSGDDFCDFSIGDSDHKREYRAISQNTIIGAKSAGICMLIYDQTENRTLIKRLEHQARIDELTGLYNRRYFQELAEREFERSTRQKRPFSILMMDIDHFKNFNDLYGHASGDYILRAVCTNLKQRLRKTDILARYGGEEFIAFLPDTIEHSAKKIAESLRMLLEETALDEESQTYHVTISIGVSSYMPGQKITLDELIERSDAVLYEAKNSGRNCICSFTEG